MFNSSLAIIVATACVFASADDTITDSVSNSSMKSGVFAVECEYYPFKISDLSYSGNSPSFGARSVLLGLRVNPIPEFALEILGGGTYNGGNVANPALSTLELPSSYAAQVRVGVAYRLIGGKLAALWAGIQGGGIYEKRLIGYYDNNTDEYAYSDYTTFSPLVVLRLEPTVTINEHFVFYTTVGLQVMRTPASKEYQSDGGSYNYQTGAYEYTYTLLEKDDASNTVALDGFCFGIRFQF